MVIVLPDELTIGSVAALRDVFLVGLREPGALQLDARPVRDLDAAGLQLLCAVARAAARRGAPIEILGGEEGSVLRLAMRTAGLGSLDNGVLEVEHGEANPGR